MQYSDFLVTYQVVNNYHKSVLEHYHSHSGIAHAHLPDTRFSQVCLCLSLEVISNFSMILRSLILPLTYFPIKQKKKISFLFPDNLHAIKVIILALTPMHWHTIATSSMISRFLSLQSAGFSLKFGFQFMLRVFSLSILFGTYIYQLPLFSCFIVFWPNYLLPIRFKYARFYLMLNF